MKRTILSLAAAMLSLAAVAQVSALKLGYCGGELASPGTVRVLNEATVQGAIYLTQEELAHYAGNSITTLNAGLASKLCIDTLTVWLRSSLDGPNLAQAVLTKNTDPKLAKGWNTVSLPEPYEITGQEGLYVGYTFHQTKTAFGLSTVGEYVPNGLFVDLGTGQWEQPTQYGVLSMEAWVEGDNLPLYDLALLGVQHKALVPQNGNLPLELRVRNAATHTISGFDVKGRIRGQENVMTAHVDCSLPYDEVQAFEATLQPEGIEAGQHYVADLWLENPDGQADQNPENDRWTVEFDVIAKEFARTVLLEEFTTEQCINCPAGAGAMHSALDMLGEEADRVAVACHHSGYYTDWLTHASDNSYLFLFNDGGSTYAPAFMIDRKAGSDDKPVFANPGAANFAQKLRNQLKNPAYVGLDVNADIDTDTRTVSVSVNGERSMEFGNDPRVTVYVLEDSIKARSQAGATGEYWHSHVLRAVNVTWGEPIEWDGDTFSYQCELTYKEACQAERLQVIAFVNDYDPDHPTQCQVYNAAFATDHTVGVSSLGADAQMSEAVYYDLTGRRVANPGRGIYVKVQGGKAVKVAF